MYKNLCSNLLKNTIFLLISFFIFSCATPKPPEIIITGKFTWNEWKTKAGWQSYEPHDYTPPAVLAEQIKGISKEKNVKYLLFAGSWCSDSKEQLPKLLNLLFDAAQIPQSSMNIYGVDRKKDEPSGMAKANKIEKVPTLIVFSNGKEIGRILETPQKSWEEDILKILIK